MVFDEIKTQIIEQMNLVVAMSIRSGWRRLDDTDERSKSRGIFGRLNG
jgi:hypothetical protein